MDPFAELAALEASSSAAMTGTAAPAPAPAVAAAPVTAPAPGDQPAAPTAGPAIDVSILGQPSLPQGAVEIPYTAPINLSPTLIPQPPAAPASAPAPAPAPAPTPAPAEGSAVTPDRNPNPPASGSEPSPAPAPQPPPTTANAAQPPSTTANDGAAVPSAVIPDKLDRRVYLHDGLSEASKLAISIMAKNPDLTPVEAATLANQRLGIATPTPAPAAPQAPAEPATPQISAGTVQTRLAAIRSEIANTDPVLDPETYRTLTLESMDLTSQLPQLLFQEAQAAHQQQVHLATTSDAQIEQSMAAARAMYPDLSRSDSPFTQAFNQELAALVESGHPLTAMPNCEEILATQVAAQLGILPSNVTPQAQPANPPAAPVAPVPAPAAPAASIPPAAPTPAAAPAPSPAQPGALPAAGMAPVSGAQATSADRVTHASPVDPQAALQQSYQQAVAAGDFAAMERLSAQMSVPAGIQPPQGYGAPPPAFAISFGSMGSAAA